MKKALFFLACGFQVFALKAQQSDHPPFLQKSFSRASVHELEAETSGGNISVYGQPSGDARVEVYINDNGRWNLSHEEIQKKLDDQYDLKVELQGSRLVVTAKQKHNFNWHNNNLSVSFRVYTPDAVSTHVRTSGGNLVLRNLTGSEDFHTSGGNIDVDHLSGTIVGRTSGGNVSISDSHNDIDLETSGGNMDAKNCEGKISLGTSGGNVNLRSVKGTIRATTSGGHVDALQVGGELQAHTSGGNVDISDMSGSLAASTSGGNLHVNFLETGKYVDLSNSGGDISVSLPQNKGMDLRIKGDKIHVTAMNNFRGDQDEHHINGQLNGGGIPVKVDGNSGSVHISFR